MARFDSSALSAALMEALFPAQGGEHPLTTLRPVLLLCLCLAPIDLYDFSLLVEFEADYIVGEFGFEFTTAVLVQWIMTLAMMLAGSAAAAVAVPDRIPVWVIQRLRPHDPSLGSRIPI